MHTCKSPSVTRKSNSILNDRTNALNECNEDVELSPTVGGAIRLGCSSRVMKNIVLLHQNGSHELWNRYAVTYRIDKYLVFELRFPFKFPKIWFFQFSDFQLCSLIKLFCDWNSIRKLNLMLEILFLIISVNFKWPNTLQSAQVKYTIFKLTLFRL